MRNRVRRFAAAALALAFVGGLGAAVLAQGVDELMGKYYAARGGLEKLKSVTSVKMTGRMSAGGRETAVTRLMKRPNRFRQEAVIGNQVIVSAFDGQRAWMINPMMGSNQPQEVPGSQTQAIKDQGDVFDGPLVDYQAKGTKIELAGEGTVDGRKTLRLKVTPKTGPPLEMELDSETYLEVRNSVQLDQAGTKVRVETFLSDYRNVDGIQLPYRIRTVINGQQQTEMVLSRIEVNVSFDESVFRMPGR